MFLIYFLSMEFAWFVSKWSILWTFYFTFIFKYIDVIILIMKHNRSQSFKKRAK